MLHPANYNQIYGSKEMFCRQTLPSRMLQSPTMTLPGNLTYLHNQRSHHTTKLHDQRQHQSTNLASAISPASLGQPPRRPRPWSPRRPRPAGHPPPNLLPLLTPASSPRRPRPRRPRRPPPGGRPPAGVLPYLRCHHPCQCTG